MQNNQNKLIEMCIVFEQSYMIEFQSIENQSYCKL